LLHDTVMILPLTVGGTFSKAKDKDNIDRRVLKDIYQS